MLTGCVGAPPNLAPDQFGAEEPTWLQLELRSPPGGADLLRRPICLEGILHVNI